METQDGNHKPSDKDSNHEISTGEKYSLQGIASLEKIGKITTVRHKGVALLGIMQPVGTYC